MKLIIIPLLSLLLISGCTTSTVPTSHFSTTSSYSSESISTSLLEENISMKINNQEISVTWEDNDSVTALKNLIDDDGLSINTTRYGGFEQVGSLPTSLPSNDVSTVTNPGDIVLYSRSSIVIFFGSNTWSYTKLGHINNLSDEELNTLLNVASATILFSKP